MHYVEHVFAALGVVYVVSIIASLVVTQMEYRERARLGR
jgi:hypothetical protein